LDLYALRTSGGGSAPLPGEKLARRRRLAVGRQKGEAGKRHLESQHPELRIEENRYCQSRWAWRLSHGENPSPQDHALGTGPGRVAHLPGNILNPSRPPSGPSCRDPRTTVRRSIRYVIG